MVADGSASALPPDVDDDSYAQHVLRLAHGHTEDDLDRALGAKMAVLRIDPSSLGCCDGAASPRRPPTASSSIAPTNHHRTDSGEMRDHDHDRDHEHEHDNVHDSDNDAKSTAASTSSRPPTPRRPRNVVPCPPAASRQDSDSAGGVASNLFSSGTHKRTKTLSFSHYDRYILQVEPKLTQPRFVASSLAATARGTANGGGRRQGHERSFSAGSKASYTALKRSLGSRLTWRRKPAPGPDLTM
jgi:hypothetical protein